MRQHRALRDADHVDDGLQLARLLGVRCAAGLRTPRHSSTRAASSARVSLLSGRQPHPQRVRRLIRLRMVAAQVLVDHAQVEPEVVGARAAAEHAAGQQHRVVGERAGMANISAAFAATLAPHDWPCSSVCARLCDVLRRRCRARARCRRPRSSRPRRPGGTPSRPRRSRPSRRSPSAGCPRRRARASAHRAPGRRVHARRARRSTLPARRSGSARQPSRCRAWQLAPPGTPAGHATVTGAASPEEGRGCAQPASKASTAGVSRCNAVSFVVAGSLNIHPVFSGRLPDALRCGRPQVGCERQFE